MSSSNTSTGDKPADPYKAANTETDVTIKQKIEDLGKFVSACKFGMMTTVDSNSGYLVSRCMALAAKETGDLDLLFFTNTESSKASDIHSQPLVNVAFLNGSGEWASVSGLSEVVTDRELVRQHYSSSLKAWLGDLGDGVHDGGQDDPRIGVIRVRTIAATYSLASKNALGRAVEVAQGAVTGKPASIHRLRELSEAEAGTWRESN